MIKAGSPAGDLTLANRPKFREAVNEIPARVSSPLAAGRELHPRRGATTLPLLGERQTRRQRAFLPLVSNFTVAARTRQGRRPSFDDAAGPEKRRTLFDAVVEAVRGLYRRAAILCCVCRAAPQAGAQPRECNERGAAPDVLTR